MNKDKQAAIMKEAAEWAKDGRFQTVIEDVISRLDSGELSPEDLPPMPQRTLRLAFGRVASELDALRLLLNPDLGELDRFPIKSVMCPHNLDGSIDLLVEVSVGNDLQHCHFQLAHMASLYIRLNNETRGANIHIADIPEDDD